MSSYERFTRECTLEQLRPELLRAIREFLLAHELAEVEPQIVMCCETTSQRTKARGSFAWLLGDEPNDVYYTGALVTPQWLIWARSGDKTGTAVISAQLKAIRVRQFASVLEKDSGLELSGYVENSHGQVRGHIGLGPEPAAQKFCETVKQAVDKVNPPRSLLDMLTLKRQ